jgi:hypothetical protein
MWWVKSVVRGNVKGMREQKELDAKTRWCASGSRALVLCQRVQIPQAPRVMTREAAEYLCSERGSTPYHRQRR